MSDFPRASAGADPPRSESEIVDACLARIRHGLDPEADLRVAGVSSMDLLDLELTLRRETGRTVSLDAIEDPLTRQRIIETLIEAPVLDPEVPTGGETSSVSPATSAQASQWLAERLRPRHRGYLVPLVIELPADTGWRDLSRVLAGLVERHPALRTAVVPAKDDPGELEQKVGAAPGMVVLEPRSVPDLSDESVAEVLDGLDTAMPSVVQGRPWRSFGLVVDGRLRGLLLLLHHVAVDDPSLRLLVREIADGLRGADVAPGSESAGAEISTLAEEGRREAECPIPDADLRWWRDRLEAMPARLDLRPTNAARTRERRRVAVIEGEEKTLLDAAGLSSGGGRSGLVLKAVRAAMARTGLTNDGDLAVGMPMSLRDRPGLERTVGMFLNTLPVSVAADDTPADIARAIREARRRRRVPYERVVREAGVDLEPLPGRSPWLDLVVGVVEGDRGAVPGLDWRVAPTGESPFPILVIVRFETDRVRIELDVDPAWISAEDADALLRGLHIELLVRGSGEAGDDRSIVRGPERRPSTFRTLPDFVRATAEAHPEKEALRDGPRSWTYREMLVEARGLANALLRDVGSATSKDGSLAGSPVAILGHPSGDTAISVLATMLAGGAAMPISADLPEGRMQDLLRRATPKAIVVASDDLLDLAARAVAAAGIDVPLLRSAERGDDAGLPELAADRACYLLFTSGSTGEPKAVRMHHAGLVGLIEHERRRTSDAVAARTAQFAPLGFDVAFQEFFSTWASGGVVIVVPSEVRRDPSALHAFIERHDVTRIHLPPLVLRALAAHATNGLPNCLAEIVCAGEALRIDDSIRRAASLGGGRPRLVNQYGPTETHVATHLDLGTNATSWPDLPRIGRPVDGVEIRIENDRGQVVRPGESGELVVCGDAVALGYLDGDAGGFESSGHDRRRYRTGDRARIDRDGLIEYLGRTDRQVKISGYRVEPGEIEAALAELDGVEDAAVVAVPRDGASMSADQGLVAFAVGPEDEETLSGLLAKLRDRLPPWMVPARLRGIEALPRSSNGKIDRTTLTRMASSLPIAGHGFGSGWTATDVLARIGRPESVDDGAEAANRTALGRLGIDSLAAIRLQMMLIEHHGVEIPVADLLSLDLDGLRSRIGVHPGGAVDAGSTRIDLTSDDASTMGGSSARGDEWTPLDPLVRDVLAEDALAPEGAFHLAWTIRFPGEIPIEEIARRLALARRRHATLRTCRRADRGERIVPVDESVPIDLEAFPARPDDDVLGRVLRHPLRVGDGIPWRAATWNDPDGGTTLVVVLHHAAVDGRTAKSIIDEIVLADEVERPVTHRASTVQTTGDPEDDAWWTDRLSKGLGGAELPEFDFEPVGAREVAFHHRGGSSFRLAAERAAALGMAPIVPALVAWGLILGRAAGRSNVVIGVPFATDLNDAGLGATVLPVAFRIDDDRPLAEVLDEVSETIALGLDHRRAALGRIVRNLEPNTSFVRPPLDGVLTRDDTIRRMDGAEITWTSTSSGVFRAGFVVPADEEDAPVAIDVESTVLDGETAAGLLARVLDTLDRISTTLSEHDRPGLRLGELDGLTPRDRARIEVFGRGDAGPAGDERDESVVDRFRRQASLRPDAVAVIDRDETVTYAELDRRSAAIAARLRDEVGDLAGRSIAIAGPRSGATIAAMIATVRSGGWFVPIDEDIPVERRDRQISSSRPAAALVVGGDPGRVPGIPVVIDPAAAAASESDFGGIPVDSEAPFYAMFTSGTTGEPRGAVIPHRAITRLADDPWFLPAGPGFRMLHAAPIAFDAATLEIWCPLLNGGTVCCWEGSTADLRGLQDRMRRDRVRGCWLTAAIFHAAVDGYPSLFDGLDVVLTGGDVVSHDHVRRLLDDRPSLAVVDGYGPTENTVFTACESMVHGGLRRGPVPVGRPVRGTSLRIVDRAGRDVAPGRFGELVAHGSGVGLGYLDDSGRPAARDGFEIDPASGELRYRTGDRVRWLEDGRIEFGGRLDAQIKIGGRRIELGAIESAIRAIPQIKDACATVLESGDRRRIGAMIVPSAVDAPDEGVIRGILAARLPDWEIPSALLLAEAIPTTRNGKPDRRLVAERLASTVSRDRTESGEPTRQDLLALVCAAIASIAGGGSVPPDRSFRDLGLDSLDLLRLAIELENRVARPVRMSDVLEGGSARAICARIAEDMDREDADLVTLQVGASPHGKALYCIPGVGGTVFSFQTIVEGLPAWLSVHGLPYPGSTGREEPLRRIEVMGRTFADRIRSTGGSPAALLGYSLGGFAAFEAARALATDGVVPQVVVIDSAPAGLPRRRSLASRVTSAREWKMRFRNVLPAGVLDRMGGKRSRALQSLRTVVAAGFDAMRDYDPAPAPIDVILLRTSETDFGPVAHLPDLGWSELARRVEVVEIPTSHLDVFRGGSLDLSRIVRAVVERSMTAR